MNINNDDKSYNINDIGINTSNINNHIHHVIGNDNINKKILETVKLKLAISTFDKKESINMVSNKRSFFKTAAIACCALFVTSGVAMATDLGEHLKNIFWPNSSEGVITAVQHGYVSNIKTDYQDSDGIAVKIDTVLMDDFNFIIDFNIKLDEKYDINKFKSLYLKDLKVVDEMGKIVFVTHESEEWKNYLGGHSYSINVKNENELIATFIASGNPEAFPKINKLFITFSQIKCYSNIDMDNKIYNGNWNFEIDLPKEFANRETIDYNVKKCNDNKTTLSKAVLSNTGSRIELTTFTDKIDYDIIHSSEAGRQIFKEVYLKTSDGKIFSPTARSDGDGNLSLSSNNTIDFYQTFNLTKYEATDKLTVVLVTNKNEKINIELER